MTIWRISNHDALDGGGGVRASARWHTRGHRVVYCAPNPATALLEVLVHAEIDFGDLPLSFRFLEIETHDGIVSETLDIRRLPDTWSGNAEATQRAGDEWIESLRSAILLVPCVIVPKTLNVLINPLHPDSRGIAIAAVHPYEVDSRLVAE